MYLRKILPYILGWCLCLPLTAQTSKIDSLKQVMASGKLSNSEKCNLLLDIAQEYEYADTAKSRMYAMEALTLAQNSGLKRAEASSYLALARYYHHFDSPKLLKYTMEALKVAQSAGFEDAEISAFNTLGNFYAFSNQYDLAHVNFKKAEKLSLKINDRERLLNAYHNLMVLFFNIDDDENSKYYGNKVLELIDVQDTITREIFAVQFLLGSARFRDSDEQEALDFYLDMYQKAKLLNFNYRRIASITLAIGEIYVRQNHPRKALPYLHVTREYYETSQMSIPDVYASLADSYAMLHQTDSADYYLKKAQNSPIVEDRSRLIVLQSQAHVESARGDYRSALETYKQFHHISDSIAKVKKSTHIARMRNWYELEQKDIENELLQQEHQKQRRLILILAGALALIFVLLALLVYFFRQSIKKNGELKDLHAVKDKLFSVVAHDLRSPIGALMSLLKLANNKMLDFETQDRLLTEISTRVDDTYGLLDNLLYWSKSQMQGITHAPAYFDVRNEICGLMDSLQTVAAAKHVTLNSSIESQEVFADRDMFAVVLRNLTTNAIKYTSAEGNVSLNSELSGDKLVISVKDTGTGMSQEVQDSLFKLSETKSRRGTRNESGTGLGLVLCADFVKVNGGNIWFISKQGEGSTFYFSVPVKGN